MSRAVTLRTKASHADPFSGRILLRHKCDMLLAQVGEGRAVDFDASCSETATVCILRARVTGSNPSGASRALLRGSIEKRGVEHCAANKGVS